MNLSPHYIAWPSREFGDQALQTLTTPETAGLWFPLFVPDPSEAWEYESSLTFWIWVIYS